MERGFRATFFQSQSHFLLNSCTNVKKIFVSRSNYGWFQRGYADVVVGLVMLRQEIPSGMCAKLRTVPPSNNRDHPTRSLSSSPFASTINCSPGSQALLEVTHQDHSIGITLLLLVRATYIIVLFFTHIPFVVNHTINATPPERLQHGLVSKKPHNIPIIQVFLHFSRVST